MDFSLVLQPPACSDVQTLSLGFHRVFSLPLDALSAGCSALLFIEGQIYHYFPLNLIALELK
jgi:hypothetical protein